MTENNIHIKSKGTIYSQAILIDGFFSSIFGKIILSAVWISGLISFVVLILNYANIVNVNFANENIGISYIFSAIFIGYMALRSFFIKRIKDASLISPAQAKEKISKGERLNLFDCFSYETALVLNKTFFKDEVSGLEFVRGVVDSKELRFILVRLGIGQDDLAKVIQKEINILPLLTSALDCAIEYGDNSITSGDIFLALYRKSDDLAKFMKDLQIEEIDIKSLVSWQKKITQEIKSRRGFFNKNNLIRTGGIGKDWIFGYTNALKRYSINLTESIKSYGLEVEVVGRKKEINAIKEALSQSQNANVIVVGNVGVGKHTTVLGFAKEVLQGEIGEGLAHDDVYQLDVESLLSGSNDVAATFSEILSEASYAGNAILLIENIDNLFSSTRVGTADLTEIILPYLEHKSLHIVGTCETEPYNEFILTNNSLVQHFVRVSVNEPKDEEMIAILEDSALMIESKTKSILTYEAIKAAIKGADKYMVNLTNPEKTINLLEGTATKATTERGSTIVLVKDVENYLSEKYALPTAEAQEDEKVKLLDLEKIMHESVIGQDEAIKAIANAMRRARAQVTDSKKPIGSFLFLGPTGVGKTATAKSLARAYFGSETSMIRFDMSEYQNSSDIYRLIGTKDEAGNLTTAVSEKPFSLLLFDEIEKANPDILNIFLQILDEGFLTDGRGQKIIFSNTIIIATSNAGSDLIRESINQGHDYDEVKKVLDDYLIKVGSFRPELLNRFNAVIAFSPLTLPEIKEVAGLIIKRMQKTLSENKGVAVDIAPDAVDLLAELGFDPNMGARPMERTIQEKVENLLAEKILKGELNKGDSITITKDMIE
jgi:ATP-dependent Clp protease ATP-binding subunit ClpC